MGTAPARPRNWWLVALLCALIPVVSCGGKGLTGTDLGKTVAPEFVLNDAAGAPLSLAGLRGQTVLLTFLYTQCPDVCPALAGKLAAAYVRLGGARDRVTFVAVSVDPRGDTADSVTAFTREHGLAALGPHWRYLLGDGASLPPVWHAYGIGAEPHPQPAAIRPGGTPEPVVIDHEAAMYLIDSRGRERVLLRPDVSTQVLVNDLKTLASE